MKNRSINNRGTLFYTMIGIMVVVLVMVVSVHILRVTYKPQAADEKSLVKFSQSIYGLKAEMQDVARYAEYPVIWETGHNVSSQGINVYLSMPDGRKQLRKDLIKGFAENYNEQLKSISTTNTTVYYTLMSNDIPITVSPIDADDMTLNETDEGFTINYTQHMESKYKTYRYSNNENIKVDVASRIFQMYDKAKAFNDNYDKTSYYTTALLYIRGYANAYAFQSGGLCGPYLKEGHISYDPINTFLSGDVNALKDTKLPDDFTDVGAIPTAVWLTEWTYLGEPNYLPPGVDLDLEHAEKTQKGIQGASTDSNYEVKIQKLKDLKTKIEETKTQIIQYKAEINNWMSEPNDYYGEQTCCSFKGKTEGTLEDIEGWIGKGASDSQTILDKGVANGVDVSEAESKIKYWGNTKSALDDYVVHLDAICSTTCSGVGDFDCTPPEDCHKSDDCDKLKCSEHDSYYKCRADRNGNYNTYKIDCKDADGTPYTDEMDVDEAECACHPNSGFVQNIRVTLEGVNKVLDNTTAELDNVESQIGNILASDAKLQEFKDISNDLGSKSGSGFDVVSSIGYGDVKYKHAIPDDWCNYYSPSTSVKDQGVCADYSESFGLYGTQITAAAGAAYLTGGALSSAMTYAMEFFPAVYDYEGNYSLNESIVDDKNRIMLHNIFSGEQDLYGLNVTPKLFTHVPSEFIIYRNRPETAESLTLGRIFLYLYLPDLGGFNAVQKGIANAQCKGIKKDGELCKYDYSC